MASNRMKRIAKEIREIEQDPGAGVGVQASPNDMTQFKGFFDGPPDTPYAGGRFYVDIKIPAEYPFKPPIMKFSTKIWHPNVSSVTGAICLDTLSSAWSPIITLKNALISLQSLLASPEPKDPQDAEVARMLIKHPEEFAHVAREWAIKYAGAPKGAPGGSSTGAGGSGGVTEESLRQKEEKAKEREEAARLAAYRGYNRALIDRFAAMGFDVPTVVSAFEYFDIDRNGGEDYELEEEYMGDITARLMGET